ncbi:acyl-ACP--UDP-N-acetylglucosamine O-acyltransferase [Rubrimonas cliftonensis]|uniref:Acyl-[acyl-carrier-protein]--UDP-N-acetylglucosamine O-acyltransferase n=1 Tax=Rubrimonas cliftonensis TaxID=89524 RepID=A0A1H4BF21_9RHOB|nr:acyl-ACP--UDP-N-acetylglucosamine O-acyltransferase [Rubrimonas cliftonensis]SEA46696.1 acyl-[acyl-carrier-protein]--UDP-N-acetylglucosamine O-acyltransferase [Rubrimonas cliftonensis]
MSAPVIHPTALVDPGAAIGARVVIGPFCVIGPDVALGEDVRLESHVVVAGQTRIGARTRVWPFASLGHQPQDLKFRGEATRLEIGADCMIREHVTMNPGTEGGGGLTRVGDRGLFMVGVHVGHDCMVGDDVILANNATLGGHVEVGDMAVLGGICAVHQRVRIGRGAMVGGMTGVEKDVIPYGSVIGDRARLAGLNLVGLKRRGAQRDDVNALRAAFRAVFHGEGSLAARAEAARTAYAGSALATEMIEFVAGHSARAYCTPED